MLTPTAVGRPCFFPISRLRVSSSREMGMSFQWVRASPISTTMRPCEALTFNSAPSVSIANSETPPSFFSSQPTQRAALPHAPEVEPSELKMRIARRALPLAGFSSKMNWSQPMPRWRSAMRRICAGVGRKPVFRASRMTKSFPSPCIFTKGILMPLI